MNPPGPTSSAGSAAPMGAIVGGSVGGFVVVAAIGAGLIFYRLRKREPPLRNSGDDGTISPGGYDGQEGTFWDPNPASSQPAETEAETFARLRYGQSYRGRVSGNLPLERY